VQLCAETLAGIADPLFPALRSAVAGTPRATAATVARALLAPLEAPAPDEPMPVWLLPHQEEAVRRARGVLERFRGVLVADGVGLGKTYIALALAALERRDGGDCVAVVPAALAEEWRRAMAHTGVVVPLLTHGGLISCTGPHAPCSLVIVDEAHAFRNSRTARYDALARHTVGRRVALLTATPFNNGPADITSLVALFAGRDRFRGLGIADIAEALQATDARPAQIALGALSVCRTRRLVEQRWPELATAFPRRTLEPPVRYDLDGCYAGRLRAVLDDLDALACAMRGAEHAAALMHLGLLRRLESSPAALRSSLRRHRAFADDALAAARSGRHLTRREFGRARRAGIADDQLILWDLLLDGEGAAPSQLPAFRAALDAVELTVEEATRDDDPKVEALAEVLKRGHAPTIVFTEHRATALYLLRRLRRRFRVLAVTGSDAWAGADRIPRMEALDAFAPLSRGRPANPLLAADVLVATDVASEGMNLQDAQAVVNYDLPWNPVRVMQRAGRIDRLCSQHRDIRVAHLIPAGGLAGLAGTLDRLRHKIVRGAHAPTAEPDPLAALWWLDRGLTPAALDEEAWQRAAPFEAWERWRALLDGADGGDRPLVAGAVVEGGAAGVGLLLTLTSTGHRAIPLPYVLGAGGSVLEDAVELGVLAERASRGRPVIIEPGLLADALATVLPLARARAAALHAAWRGVVLMAPGRRAVLGILDHAIARGRRDRTDVMVLEEAAARLAHDVPAGVERRLGELARSTSSGELIAHEALRLTAHQPAPEQTAPPPPRLALAAALVVTARCPGRD